jgi:lysophospholipase L1-like esterase
VDYPPWERSLVRLRQWIHDFAEQMDLKVIDFHKAFYDEKDNLLTDLLLPDGGHPTRSGYKAMFEQIDISIFT